MIENTPSQPSHTLPVIAIVGRPNVGKSTLFNRLTRTRNALISAFPGTTRDRQYGEYRHFDKRFIVIDTGGLADEHDPMSHLITEQVNQALDEADTIIFVIDGQAGVLPTDYDIANKLRSRGKKVFLAVNKSEGREPNALLGDAYELGLGEPVLISSAHGRGINELMAPIIAEAEQSLKEQSDDHAPTGIKIAIVGKPNVGKSTLTNRLLGEDRVIVHDSPGTTRDSIYIALERNDEHYTLIDTAGVRKRKNVTELPEKFSIVKTLQSIEDANVVLFVIDGRKGVSEQDLKLLGFVLECGKCLVIAVNKWDHMTQEARDATKASIDRELDFVSFARIHFISALHGSGTGNLFNSIQESYQSATKPLATSSLTRLLQQALVTHSPPLVRGRRIKLRYAHLGGSNPPTIVIHGTRLDDLPESYRRFLARFFQEKLEMHGTPVQLQLKNTDNPYSST